MEETDVLGGTEQTPPQFELDQSDDYSQFLLHSKAEIFAVLRALLKKGAMITVHFDQGQSFLLTSIISLSADNRELVLDIGSDEEMNRRALLAKRLIFTSIIDKVKVQFSLNKLSSTTSDGRTAFLATVPDAVLRLQRREFYRLSTPVVNPVKLKATLRRADDSVLRVELPLTDISGGGVGLMATVDQALLFRRGDTLNECNLMLPDEGLLVATLCVRNLFDVTTRSGSHFTRIGCEFVGLPAPRLTMVQRYITRVERERKARMTGMS